MIKLFKKCETCRKRRFLIKNQKIMLPVGGIATSQKLMCKKCLNLIHQAINKK